MKHLKKIFEASGITKEDILENFIYITDKFGEPTVTSSAYGNLVKWTISWNIQLNLSVLQEADKFISKLRDLVEDIDDVLAARDRLENYNINISLDNKLKLELLPKDTGGGDYKFISHYEWRTIYVRINEVERFLNSKGIRVLKYVETDDGWDQGSLLIYFSKLDTDVIPEICRLINNELQQIEDREYECEYHNDHLLIFPLGEKSYVGVTTK